MRFNDKELAHLSLGEAKLEGRLNYKKSSSGNITQTSGGIKERWFKLISNLLFYFRINEVGQIDLKQPAGVFVLENSSIQAELSTGVPFAFSMTFSDDPDKKHYFIARTEDVVHNWVSTIKHATYEYLRSQMIILQKKINNITGIDPLLMYPHNRGTIRHFEDGKEDKEASFQSHISLLTKTTVASKSSVIEGNLIEL
ncbi:pleckstrin homology domain-containing family J member 1-like [Lycorma delicatula]|uniref:pleckstrin homology domain-containing family J member 1-like n=1 Tax=Lycorma delicatula TaxID=130591 RepID=UPI003F511F89